MAHRFLRPGVLLAILAGLLFLPRLGVRDLWPPDEARFALIAEDMVRGGSWIAPNHLGRTYAEKPPLQLWAVALASLPAGRVDEASARLPSALAAIGSVVLTFVLGRRLFGASIGVAGALVLLTSGHFVMRARWSCTDPLLAFFTLAALVLARAWMDAQGRRWPLGVGFFAACALATLTKGPVGLVLPCAILVLGLAIERRWREIWKFPWVLGGALYLVVVVPWYVAYAREAGGGSLTTVLLLENVTRFLHAWNNVQPWWFYFGRFPLSFLPWAAFFPAAAWAICRVSRPEERPALRWLVLWIGVLFAFFSVSSGKRTVYLLPLFPAAALLVGWTLTTALPRAGPRGTLALRLSAAPLLFLMALTAIASPALLPSIHASVQGPALAVSLLLAVAAAWLAAVLVRAQPVAFLGGLVAVVLALVLVSEHVVLPRLNAYHNVRQVAAQLAAAVPPGARLATTEARREVLFFYSGRRGVRVESGEELARFLAGPTPAYCLLPLEDWERWRRAHHLTAAVRRLPLMSGDSFVLVTREGEKVATTGL